MLLGFSPLYNFAVVVDDHEMGISHVIRGEDHIANTPKQIAMQRALNFNVPTYAHLPLILNPDRSKLSKRYAETSLLAYRGKYLPEAVINFMAFLGWHPKEEKDVMTAEELIKEFDLERVQKAGAVFNEEKLKWLNAEHMKRKQDQVIQTTAQGILENYSGVTPEKAHSTAELIFSRMKTLDDYNELAKPILELLFYEPELLIWKNTNKSIAKAHLGAVKKIINELEPLDLNRAEEAIMAYANTEGRGEVLWPLRVALSGERDSQGPFELMKVLGKDETLRRINIAINKL
ncbi:MAG: hypothetical protein HYT12_02555 [Candidatus Liptonbacteria bacterium]|nr:hypothetical protein [Candidatus Liptonbacteria bacterium]